MNIKAILASTLLTALFAGTSVIADDMVLSGKKSAADIETTHSSVEKQRVNYQIATFDNEDSVVSGKK